MMSYGIIMTLCVPSEVGVLNAHCATYYDYISYKNLDKKQIESHHTYYRFSYLSYRYLHVRFAEMDSRDHVAR